MCLCFLVGLRWHSTMPTPTLTPTSSREEIACVGRKTVAVLGQSVSVLVSWNANFTNLGFNASYMQSTEGYVGFVCRFYQNVGSLLFCGLIFRTRCELNQYYRAMRVTHENPHRFPCVPYNSHGIWNLKVMVTFSFVSIVCSSCMEV